MNKINLSILGEDIHALHVEGLLKKDNSYKCVLTERNYKITLKGPLKTTTISYNFHDQRGFYNDAPLTEKQINWLGTFFEFVNTQIAQKKVGLFTSTDT
jgi:hypothetical protein